MRQFITLGVFITCINTATLWGNFMFGGGSPETDFRVYMTSLNSSLDNELIQLDLTLKPENIESGQKFKVQCLVARPAAGKKSPEHDKRTDFPAAARFSEFCTVFFQEIGKKLGVEFPNDQEPPIPTLEVGQCPKCLFDKLSPEMQAKLATETEKSLEQKFKKLAKFRLARAALNKLFDQLNSKPMSYRRVWRFRPVEEETERKKRSAHQGFVYLSISSVVPETPVASSSSAAACNSEAPEKSKSLLGKKRRAEESWTVRERREVSYKNIHDLPDLIETWMETMWGNVKAHFASKTSGHMYN